MSVLEIFTFSVVYAIQIILHCVPALTQATEDLCLKKGTTYAENSIKGLGEMEE